MVRDIVGGLIAFICSVSATYLDCYQVLREKAWRVPAQFWQSVGLGLLAVCCGTLAASAFVFWLSGNTGFLDVVLGAAVPDHIARGFYTGFAVLPPIRSKVFQVKGADIGAEYACKEIRAICLRGINVAATAWRARHLTDHIPAILERMVGDNDFESQSQDLIRGRRGKCGREDADDGRVAAGKGHSG